MCCETIIHGSKIRPLSSSKQRNCIYLSPQSATTPEQYRRMVIPGTLHFTAHTWYVVTGKVYPGLGNPSTFTPIAPSAAGTVLLPPCLVPVNQVQYLPVIYYSTTTVCGYRGIFYGVFIRRLNFFFAHTDRLVQPQKGPKLCQSRSNAACNVIIMSHTLPGIYIVRTW